MHSIQCLMNRQQKYFEGQQEIRVILRMMPVIQASENCLRLAR